MNKVLEVILKLNDQFTAPLRGSEGGLKSFGSEMKSFIAGAVTLGGITAALNKAWNEADELTRSMQRVEGTAKIVNVPLQVVKDTADAAAKTFGLSATSANNFASSAVTMAAKAGDASKATELMASVLDLAAARGISADDALEALNITLKGQDEGLDKLVQKNPSAYYQSWAEAAGRSAGSLTEVEKKLAIVDGLLADAAPVRGAFTDWLTTVDGKAFLAGQSMEEATAKFGIATETLRIQMLSAKATGADLLGGVVEFFQKLGVGLAVAWDRAGATFSLGIANIQIALGEFIAGNRLVLMVLGDTATEIGDRMANAGTQRKMAATRQLGELRRLQDEMNAEIEGAAVLAGRNIAAASEESAQAQIKSGKTVVRASKEDAAELVKIHEEAARIIAEVWGESAEDIERFIDDVVAEANILTDVQDALLATINDGMGAITGSAGAAADGIKRVDNNTVNAARGAISLAREFGAIDENAASVLNNVVNLADTLSNIGEKVGAGDLVSIIGASVGILNGLFNGNPAHMALIRKNIDSLEELTRSNGLLLRAQSTGAKVAAAKGGLAGFDDIAKIVGTSAGINATRFQGFRGLLQSLGLTVGDAEQLAKDFGIDLGIENGGISQGAVQAFIQGLQTANFGKVGDTFADQTDFLDRYFKVAGIADPALQAAFIADAIKEDNAFLADLLKKYDFNTAEGRAGLQAEFVSIFQRLQNGTFDSALFGNLSGAEFVDFIESFTDLIGGIGSGFAGGAGIGGGSVTGASFSGVTFATASYDLGIVLFAPIARMDTNLAEAVSILRDIRAINISIGTINGGDPAAFKSAALDAINEALAAERDLSSAAEG